MFSFKNMLQKLKAEKQEIPTGATFISSPEVVQLDFSVDEISFSSYSLDHAGVRIKRKWFKQIQV